MRPRAADAALVVDLDGVLRIWDPEIVASAERRAGLPTGTLDRAAFADAATLRAVVTGRISDAEWGAGIAARLVAVHGEARPERWPTGRAPAGRSTSASSPSSGSSAAPVPWRC
jgi:putative hydrolase of the HAD superfamily